MRGRDLRKFSYEKPGQYLFYDPEQLQQVAPEKFYRAREKLIYRFVGKVPVFSYDGAQMFTLNSANILIPHLPGLDMKYVLAVLNSRTVSFWWQKKYNALKMLRSHLESIPIPIPKPKVQETRQKGKQKALSGGSYTESLRASSWICMSWRKEKKRSFLRPHRKMRVFCKRRAESIAKNKRQVPPYLPF